MIKSSLQLRVDRFSDRKGGHPSRPSTQTILGTILGDSSMKQIELTQGQVALVDDEDFEWLNQWRWRNCKCANGNNIILTYSYSRMGRTLYTHIPHISFMCVESN